MGADYRVVDVDGKEHGPLSALELGRLYSDGRIKRDSYVFDPKSGGWRRLEEIVDMSRIERLREKLEGDSVLETTPSPSPSLTPSISGMPSPGGDSARTPGTVAAAVLLFVNAGINALGATILVSEASVKPGGLLIGTIFVDAIIAVGLIRGKDAYVKWAVIRAVIGAILFSLIRPLFTSVPGVGMMGIYQIVFSAALIALLFSRLKRSQS